MLRELSVADTPYRVLSSFARGYWPLRPIDYMLSLSTRDLPEGQYRITRNIDVAGVLAGRTQMPEIDPRARGPLPVHSGGFIGSVIAGKHPVLIHDMDVPSDPVLGDQLKDYGSALFIPLFDEGQPRYWNIQFRKGAEGFTLPELEQAAIVSNLVG